MKEVWKYLAVAGFSIALGIIIAVKWLVEGGDKISVEIRKLKQKRTSGENSISIPVNVDNASESQLTRKMERLQRRMLRKKERMERKKQ